MVSDARKDQMKAYISRRRDERKRSGLCTECGEPTDGRHSRCFNCRLKNAAAQARFQRRRIGMEV